MIAFEELCEALERFKRRQQNQAELDHLNAAPSPGPTTEIFSAKPKGRKDGFAADPPEDTHEIDVDQMVLDER